MKRIHLVALACLLLPAAAHAEQPCAHSEPHALELDAQGVKRILFDIGPHKLRLQAGPGADAGLRGRACAASSGDLARLDLTQERRGDVLEVRLLREERRGISFGNRYAYLDLEGSVPDDVLVQLKVGSGDAWLTGGASASADVGSGDVEVRDVRGAVTAKVGSGDAEFDGIGSLELLSLGSGDVGARRVRGAVEVGSVGSGDLELQDVGGDVDIGSVGSGDVALAGVGGSVRVGSIGSGDLDASNVRGDLVVRSVGSGDVDHRDVGGNLDIPRKR